MKLILAALCVCCSLALLSVLEAASTPSHDLRLECSEAGTPAAFKSVAARASMVDLITKLFKCLEKTMTSSYRVVLSIVKDVTSCMAKFPTDFFKCLARLNVPQKLSEIINALMDTFNCVS